MICLDGPLSKHVYFWCTLFKIDIACVKNSTTIDQNYKCENVKNMASFFLTNEYLNKKIHVAKFPEKDFDTVVECKENIDKLVNDLFVKKYPEIKYVASDPETIAWSFKLVYNRDIEKDELEEHSIRNKKITMLEWFLILYLCEEGIGIDSLIKPRLAVIFSGFVRTYKNTNQSQQKLISNPNVDTFIHTWNNHGYKNKHNLNAVWLDPESKTTDKNDLLELYKPKKILVENHSELLPTLSLREKIYPIFLFAYQARDDATRYINSQLYSIYSAYKLIEEYEKENDIQYDGILKLRFDFKITGIQIHKILSQITLPDSAWFAHSAFCGHAHYGGGGGCMSCDRGLEHSQHTNDICDILFYAGRETAQKACEVFLHGQDILKKNMRYNINALTSVPTPRHAYVGNFVYIETFADIEEKFVCFYPESLLRRHLEGTNCFSSYMIAGHII